MAKYGVWSEYSGGFVETGFTSREETEGRIEEMVQEEVDEASTGAEAAEAERAAEEDYRVVRECDDHEEQPKEGCGECESEDGEDDAEGED